MLKVRNSKGFNCSVTSIYMKVKFWTVTFLSGIRLDIFLKLIHLVYV